MLLNHVRVTHEHLSSQDNTDAIPPGKLTSIYLQNTVAVFLCIIPFLRKEKLAYTHSSKVVLASQSCVQDPKDQFKSPSGSLPLQ